MDLMTVIQSFWNEMVPHLVGMIGQNFRLWSYWSCKNGHALLLTSLDKIMSVSGQSEYSGHLSCFTKSRGNCPRGAHHCGTFAMKPSLASRYYITYLLCVHFVGRQATSDVTVLNDVGVIHLKHFARCIALCRVTKLHSSSSQFQTASCATTNVHSGKFYYDQCQQQGDVTVRP